jgi:hypothetical protein
MGGLLFDELPVHQLDVAGFRRGVVAEGCADDQRASWAQTRCNFAPVWSPKDGRAKCVWVVQMNEEAGLAVRRWVFSAGLGLGKDRTKFLI